MALIDWGRRPAAAPIVRREPVAPALPVPASGEARSQREAAPRAAIGREVTITSPEELEAYLRQGNDSSSGASVNTESALRIAAFYRCNAIIAGAVATLPIKIKRRIDQRTRRDADDHPLWELMLRRPNRWQTPSEFRRMLQSQIHLRGNGYALIVGSGRRPLELLPLDAGRMKVEQLDSLELVYSYTRRNGSTQTFPQRDIFHLRGLTLDGVKGLSVLGYAREALGLAIQTERHGGALFKNGTRVGMVLKHPEKLSPEAYDRLIASLEEYRGAENAAKTLLTEEGMDVDTVGMTAEDAQFLETRKFQRSEIAMFFGVPPHMLGDTDKSTSWGSGIEQQGIGFVTYALEDWLTTWEETIGRDLIDPSEPDLYARFNRAALVKGDLKTRWESYVKGLQWGVYSPNDVRANEDMNPRDGGDIYYPPPNTAGGGSPEESANEPAQPPEDQSE